MRPIDSVALIKKVRVKTNSKPWFGAEVFQQYKKNETHYILQKVRLTNRYRKNSKLQKYSEEKLVQNSQNPRESWNSEVSWFKC